MKKIVVVVAVLLVAGAAWAGGAWLAGGKVQSALRTQTEKLGTQFPALKVAEASYERGAFSSTRTVTYTFGCLPPAARGAGDVAVASALGGAPLTVTVRDRIRHGPFAGGKLGVAVIDSEIVLPEEAAAELARYFGEKPPLTIQTVVGFGGGYTATVESPPLQTALEKGERLDWKGVRGTLRADGSGTEASYEATVPGLEIIAADGVRFALADGTFSGTVRPVDGSIWVASGTGEGRLASVEVSGKETPGGGAALAFALRDLRFTSESTVTDGLLGTRTTMAGSGSFGEVQLQKIELDVAIRRVHAASYQKVMSAFMNASCEPQAQQDPAAVLAAIQGDLGELLRHDPEYAMDRLVVELDGKRGELSYSAGVQGVTAEDAALPPQALLATRGKLEASARLPIEWVTRLAAFFAAQSPQPVPPEQVAAMLDQLAAQGLLAIEGEHVRSTVRFAQGALTVNGVPMPLPGQR